MTTISINHIDLSAPPPIGGFYVEIAWRYGTSGSYTGAYPSIHVDVDGNLAFPALITYDETINPLIQVRVKYLNCTSTITYNVDIQDNTTSTSSTTTAPPTTTTTTTTTTSTTTTTTIYPPVIVYWGFKPTNTTLTPVEIEASPFFDTINHNDTIIADYTTNSDPQFLWMAEPIGETAKTRWFGTFFNQGDIGAPEDLFGTPVISGGYRFYITQYLTQQTETPIEFRIS